MILIDRTYPGKPLVIPQPVEGALTPQYNPIVLKPGVNVVEDSLEKVIKESATIQHWIAKKQLVLKKGTPAKSGEKRSSELEAFDEESALDLVNDCFDPKQLKAWQTVDRRDSIRMACVERIDELKRVVASVQPDVVMD